METESEYQRVLSFLDQLHSMNATLNERALLISYSETTRAIELHFDKCMKELRSRKDALLLDAANKLQVHQKILEGQQKELNDSINGCTRILEGGSLLYGTNRDVAITIWKNISTIEAPKLEERIIGVKLPEIILDVIGNHGTATSEIKRISRSKAGYVGTIASHQLGSPSAIHFSPHDGLYICDTSSSMIKKVTQGKVSTVTSTNCLKSLGGMSICHKGAIIYASDTVCHTIKKRTTSSLFGAKFEVFAGSSSPGNKDGVGSHASFKNPGSLAVDQLTGDVYVADIGNNTIRKITPQGVVTTLAGSGRGYADGIGTAAKFSFNDNTTIWYCTKTQSLLVCDSNRLRKVTTCNGEVSTIPCNINAPRGVVALSETSIIVSSVKDNKLFHITKQGMDKYEVTVLAGSGDAGDQDGIPSLCKFNSPHGIAFDEQTNTCYVADFFNRSIKKFTIF